MGGLDEALQVCGTYLPLGIGVTRPPFSVVYVMEWQCVAHVLRLRQHSTSPEVNVRTTKITCNCSAQICLLSPMHFLFDIYSHQHRLTDIYFILLTSSI